MDYGGEDLLRVPFFDNLFSCSLRETQAARRARVFVDERAKVRASPMGLANRLLELDHDIARLKQVHGKFTAEILPNRISR